MCHDETRQGGKQPARELLSVFASTGVLTRGWGAAAGCGAWCNLWGALWAFEYCDCAFLGG